MYQMNTRVRYSEVGLDKKVSMARLVDYFQDCSTFQSEDVGRGIAVLEESSRAWLLCAWQIDVEQYPIFGDQIHIGTWPYDAGGLYAYRNFECVNESGHRIASANSIWFYVDTTTGKPTRITSDDIQVYGSGEPLPMEYASRKIKLFGEFEEAEPFQVLKMHIDTNHHVNNAQYIQMAQEFVPKHFKIKRMRADYKKAAILHDVIVPRVSKDDLRCTVQLCDLEGAPYVVVEFCQ